MTNTALVTVQPDVSAYLTVAAMSSTRDTNSARMLLAAQREWMASIGIAVATSGPNSSGNDYDDPARFYNRTGGVLLIARLGCEPVGVVGLRQLHRGSRIAELRRLFVTRSARGYGAGRALVEQVLNDAQMMGYDEVVLETVPEKMIDATKLYRSMGFEPRRSMRLSPRPGQIAMRRGLRDRRPNVTPKNPARQRSLTPVLATAW